MSAVPCVSFAAARATRTASPVPRGGSCIATVAPSESTERAAEFSAESTPTARAPTSASVARTWASSGRPAALCRTLGVWDRIRVPNPAASTMPSGDPVTRFASGGGLGRQDSNLGSGIQSPLPYHLATPQGTTRLGTWPKNRVPALPLGPVRRLLSATDELRDTPPALAAELRVALAAKL